MRSTRMYQCALRDDHRADVMLRHVATTQCVNGSSAYATSFTFYYTNSLRWYAAGDEKKHHWVKVGNVLMFTRSSVDIVIQFEEQSDALASMGITGESIALDSQHRTDVTSCLAST